MSQLQDLARPIPKRLIEAAPTGKHGTYVPHFVIVQALLATVGPYDWQLVQVLRSNVPEYKTKDGKVYPALTDAVVGVVMRLTCKVDGRSTIIEETGSCEAEAFESNDGERLKKAMSDALKRCAMRLGVAIHLWCKRPDQFFLPRILAETADLPAPDEEAVVGVEEAEPADPTSPPVLAEPPTLTDSSSISEPPADSTGSTPTPSSPSSGKVSVEEGITNVIDGLDGTVVDNEAEVAWVSLIELLSVPAGQGTAKQIEERTAWLCQLMETNGLWPADSLLALLQSYEHVNEWGKVGPKAKQVAFAERVFAKAAGKVKEMLASS